MTDLQNNKEMIAVGHEFARTLSSDTPIIEIAKMITRLAGRLDCATLALREMTKQRDAADQAERVWESTMMDACGEDGPKSVADKFAELKAQCATLAAENAGLKSAASYFSYGSEHNFEWHKTAEEAVEAAEAAIDDYRGDACDGWSEEVDSVCWGVIMQSSTKVGERPRNEDDRCDPAIITICDYALLPNIETPATDAFLAEVRAQGVEMMAAEAEQLMDEFGDDSYKVMVTADLQRFANAFAAQLRQEAAQ
ncbi:hypothetical protein RS420_003945 [Enterobacter roggenkampii]|nr:hypothetical protein [Enterobacter roggenkampii]